jgi:Tol biopolymer transport system component
MCMTPLTFLIAAAGIAMGPLQHTMPPPHTMPQPHNMIMFHYPRWSPDGNWLVFTSNIDGDDEVWIVSRDGTQKRQLTDNSISDNNADWHPDGQHIVFQRHEGGRVDRLIMNRDGSNVRKYEPPAPRPVAGLLVQERRTANGQAVILTRGGVERRISTVTWAEQPSVSPDGRFVVFEQRDDPNDIIGSDIAVWDTQREGPPTVIARGTDPSWSPDGRSILCKTPKGPVNALFVAIVDLASGSLRVLAPGVHPQFSPDGKQVAYMSDRMDRADVYVIGTDGSGQSCITCGFTAG